MIKSLSEDEKFKLETSLDAQALIKPKIPFKPCLKPEIGFSSVGMTIAGRQIKTGS